MRVGIVMRSEIWRDSLGMLLSSMKETGGPESPVTSDICQWDHSQEYDVLILEESTWKISEEARERYPTCGLMLLTHMIQLPLVKELFSSDPQGKGYSTWGDLTTADQLVQDLIGLRAGRSIMSHSVLETYLKTQYGTGGYRERLGRLLTRREVEVLQLMSDGKKNGQIAKELYIQPRTVEHHINQILSKMGIDGQSDIAHPRVAAVLLYLQGKIHRKDVSEDEAVSESGHRDGMVNGSLRSYGVRPSLDC